MEQRSTDTRNLGHRMSYRLQLHTEVALQIVKDSTELVQCHLEVREQMSSITLPKPS